MGPRVSICIPAYNHGPFIEAAIQSALAQSWSDLEIVVSDNRSTDNTRELVLAIAAVDARVRYEPTSEHIGMAENFNRCVALARGEYIKFVCSDDMLEPGSVEELVRALEKEGAVLAAGARRFVDEAGMETGTARFAAQNWSGKGQDAAKRCFYLGNLIGEPTAVLFRKADFGSGFSPRYTQLVDLDLWFRLLE